MATKACENCNNFLFDQDMEVEHLCCTQGYFNYSLYPNGESNGDYVSIQKRPCKGKKYESSKIIKNKKSLKL